MGGGTFVVLQRLKFYLSNGIYIEKKKKIIVIKKYRSSESAKFTIDHGDRNTHDILADFSDHLNAILISILSKNPKFSKKIVSIVGEKVYFG